MKNKVNLVLLRIYDLLLALGFILTGVLMISSKYGIFAEGFPKEFSDVLPFDSWVIPGIILIIVFGAGNLAALMDTAGASSFLSAVLLAVTIVINTINLFIHFNKTVK
jgi:hypothetical protein